MLKRKAEDEGDHALPKRHRPDASAQFSPPSSSSSSPKVSIAEALVLTAKAKNDDGKSAKSSASITQSNIAGSASSSAQTLFSPSSSAAASQTQAKKSDDGQSTKDPVTTKITTSFFYSDNKISSSHPDVGLAYLQKIPPLELYRLIVDGVFHEFGNGWESYERRGPGDLEQIIQALAIAVREINNKPLTVDFIKKLHAICMTRKNYAIKGIHIPGEFRAHSGARPCIGLPRSCSLAGLEEFFSRMVKSKDQLIGGRIVHLGKLILCSCITDEELDEKNRPELVKKFYEQVTSEAIEVLYYPYVPKIDSLVPAQTIAECMQVITDSFNQAIAEAKTQDAKIKVIVKHIKDYECLHPFIDGNTRVFVTVLTNFLLMQNGMCPATFADPNIFYVLSDDELVEHIKAAQRNTMRLIAGEQLFKFDTNTLPLEKQQQFLEWTKPLCDALAALSSSVSNDKNLKVPKPK